MGLPKAAAAIAAVLLSQGRCALPSLGWLLHHPGCYYQLPAAAGPSFLPPQRRLSAMAFSLAIW